jgi:hypothetical protein
MVLRKSSTLEVVGFVLLSASFVFFAGIVKSPFARQAAHLPFI